MTDTTIIAEPELDEEKALLEVPESVAVVRPANNFSTTSPVPRVMAWRSGSLTLQGCHVARNSQSCESCHLRAFCRCAWEEFHTGVASERKLWTVLSLCASVSLLYAAFCFFFQS